MFHLRLSWLTSFLESRPSSQTWMKQDFSIAAVQMRNASSFLEGLIVARTCSTQSSILSSRRSAVYWVCQKKDYGKFSLSKNSHLDGTHSWFKLTLTKLWSWEVVTLLMEYCLIPIQNKHATFSLMTSEGFHFLEISLRSQKTVQ